MKKSTCFRFVFILVAAKVFATSAHAQSNGELSPRTLQAMMERIDQINPNDPLASQIRAQGLKKALIDPTVVNWHARPFTKEVLSGNIENQGASGDCWIYATLNVLKTAVITSGKGDANFEFSKNYIYFYSVMEKVNSYFENLINERISSLSSKKFRKDFVLADDSREYMIADGGEFGWMRFLVNKYGLVPEVAMPSTKVTVDDSLMLSMVRMQVLANAKKMAAQIRSFGPGPYSSEQTRKLRALKHHAEFSVISILKITLGDPPTETRPFQFTTASGTHSFTPRSFMKDYLEIDLSDYLSIASTPMVPFNRTYQILEHSSIGIQSPGSSAGDLRYYNEKPARLAELVKRSIDAGQAVYFGTDVIPNVADDSGTMDLRLFKVDPFLNPATPSLSIKDQMSAGLIFPDHAMAFVGYETDPSGKLIRFKVENSWGKGEGQNGFFSMSREWFEIFVQEVAIHKSLVNVDEFQAWSSTNPITVKTYDDFFGTE